MPESSRHVPLRPSTWSGGDVVAAIEEIASDARARFDSDRFWPMHLLDGEGQDGGTSLYCGAAGVIWALDHLVRSGATKTHFDIRPFLPRLMQAAQPDPSAESAAALRGSFLIGDLGAALLSMRLAPTPAAADLVQACADATTNMPVRELMWGIPGAMLACVHMAAIAPDPRWQALFATQAGRLLEDLEETADGPMWTQDFSGRQVQYLGAVHGYASNMIPLIRGWNWLTDVQRGRVADAATRTLAAHAWRTDRGTTWPAVVGESSPPRCHHCHGAPGIVTTFADAPFTAPALEALLIDGGEFIWAAGPLAKGSNLCHGTGGNGYAFLKLHRRTKDPIWLARARAFAMTAIAQCREAREQYGRGRYSLWTGDIGLAIYLRDCLTAEPGFPSIDVF